MYSNKKNCPTVQTIFFLLLLTTCLQNSFANSFNDDAAIKEITIKIMNVQPDLPTLTFKEPGKQKITIENHLQKDVNIGDIVFWGDEFTSPPIAHDISIPSYSGCSTIKAKTCGVSLFLESLWHVP